MYCSFLEIKHNIHSSFEKSLIEKTTQDIKDRTESFYDYFPCRKPKFKPKHIKQWIIHMIVLILDLNFTVPKKEPNVVRQK